MWSWHDLQPRPGHPPSHLRCTSFDPTPALNAQVATWHKMFTREARLREAMKRVIAVMWGADVAPAATGYTANDIIMGIESGERRGLQPQG